MFQTGNYLKHGARTGCGCMARIERAHALLDRLLTATTSQPIESFATTDLNITGWLREQSLQPALPKEQPVKYMQMKTGQ